jgi:hypothetical protein
MTNGTEVTKALARLKKMDNNGIREVLNGLLYELNRRAMRGYENEPREHIGRTTRDYLTDAFEAIENAFERGNLNE